MSYPENCIRGITHQGQLLHEDQARASISLFEFGEDKPTSNGWLCESVNWKDHDEAVNLILSQTKVDGELQFKEGYALIPRNDLDRIKKKYQFLNYERAIQPNNPYHGNLLLKPNLQKSTKRLICGLLADASSIIRRVVS